MGLRRRYALALALVLVGTGGCPKKSSDAAADGEPPRLRLEDLHGAAFDPLARLGDGPGVFVFVSTHCPISNRYAPTLVELHERLRERGIAITLVYPDPDDDRRAIEAHRREYALEMVAIRDPKHDLVDLTGVEVTPEAAVLEREGDALQIRYRGRIDDRAVEFGSFRARAKQRDLAEAIDAVLEGRPVARTPVPAVGCYISDLR